MCTYVINPISIWQTDVVYHTKRGRVLESKRETAMPAMTAC